MTELYDIYENLKTVEAQIYKLYKRSDEPNSVHLTMIQQDVDSALTVIEDLLGIE